MKKSAQKRAYVSQEDVPAFSLEEALRIPQAIFENYGKAPTAPIKVAAAMNMAPGGKQFKMLCGAAIAYGLTSGGYNSAAISIEPIARRILTPKEDGDELKAKREAFLKPRVTREFIERYNNSPLPKQDIAINVIEDLGVPRERCASLFEAIVGTAERLGLLQVIRDKKYINVDASAIPKNNVDGTASEVGEKSLQDKSAVLATQPAKHDVVSESNGRSVADSSRAKRVFITHGKNKSFVDPIKKFLQFGELEAVVAIEKQTVSEPVPDKVMNDMRSCGAAIIHVEGEQKLLDASGTEHTVLNPNVLIEIGAAMALYGSRFILLVNEGVKLPTNLQGLFCVRYSGETLNSDVTMKLLGAIDELKKRPLVYGAPIDRVGPAHN